MCCRQCFRSNAKEIGFIKVNALFLISPLESIIYLFLMSCPPSTKYFVTLPH
ncbi:hypothetical protein LINPERPRIM_LOCUS15383 [Linum perenne]